MEPNVRPRPHGSPGRGVGIFPEEDDLVPLDQTEQAGRTVAVPAPAWTAINPGFSHRHSLRGLNKLK